MTKIITTINKAVFTNAPDGTETDPGKVPAQIYVETATIKTKTTTTDTNISIVTNEIKTPASEGVDPNAFFETIIITTDLDAVIETSGVVSSPKVQVVTTGTDRVEDGKLITEVYSRVVMPGSTFDVYVSSEDTGLVDAPPPVPCRYLICKHDLIAPYLHGNADGDQQMFCQEMYGLMNIICAKISEPLYQMAKLTWRGEKVLEIDADAAYYGSNFFGEIRPIGKVWEAKTTWYGEKVPVVITPEIQEHILNMMKSFAYELIESEFDRKYLAMRDASDLEVVSWQMQKEEAEEWLEFQGQDGSVTPLLDYLAEEQGLDKTVLAKKILQKTHEWKDKLSVMLTSLKKLEKQFERCTTVWDINVLYEDYFGVAMPVKQAIELGRTISDTDWNRKPEWRVKGNGFYF